MNTYQRVIPGMQEDAADKRLRHLVVVDEVPRLPSGKALRRQLQDRWATGDL